MRLYFKQADLLLSKTEQGDYALEQCGEVLARFKNERQALAAYNQIRRDLEQKFPPTELTHAERRALFAKYVADTLVGHNSMRDTIAKKPAKSRTFG